MGADRSLRIMSMRSLSTAELLDSMAFFALSAGNPMRVSSLTKFAVSSSVAGSFLGSLAVCFVYGYLTFFPYLML